MTFDEYIKNWFKSFLDEQEDDFVVNMYETLTGSDDSDIAYKRQFLVSDADADVIYDFLFVSGDLSDKYRACMPEPSVLLQDMFEEACLDIEYTFAKSFVEDMAYHAEGYSDPIDFFNDLTHGGCISGMIGMLIYNSDCKDIYIEHIDSMECFKEDFEEELGEPIVNQKRLPHYTFMCWFCYEELAYRIARELWPDVF